MSSSQEAVVADLGTVLDEARIVIDPAMREAGITTAWEISNGLPLVRADHHGLLQALINLARNSLQALETSSRKEVRIHATLERDLVVVRFFDSGPGVAHPEDLFRPFQPGAHSVGLGFIYYEGHTAIARGWIAVSFAHIGELLCRGALARG